MPAGSSRFQDETEPSAVENVRELEWMLGEAWTGVNFYFSGAAVPDVRVGEDLRFCEALAQARSGPLLLHPGTVSCAGANYVFGWERDDALKNRIVGKLMMRRGLGQKPARKLLSQVPVFEDSLVAIGLNTGEVPDLIVSYCQPRTAMQFLKMWQAAFEGINLSGSFSSILSVCGNVATGCYQSGEVRLSFGCDDSREFGGIGRDRLVLGLPYALIERLLPGRRNLTVSKVS